MLSRISKSPNSLKYNFRCMSSRKGIIEIRTYKGFPQHSSEYLRHANASAGLRERYCGDRWKLFLRPETGYGSLSDFIHIYHYPGMQERFESRKKMGEDKNWNDFLIASRPCLQEQSSEIFCPANIILNEGQNDFEYFSIPEEANSLDAVYEIRHYQLIPGYETVPQLIEIFNEGLPDKINACDSSTGRLILLAHSDVGLLNQFIEIWRWI